MNIIQKGSITTPLGYKAAGIHCGLKKNSKKDLAMLVSELPAKASGLFTENIVKGHSLMLTMDHIKNGTTRCILINSGNANACLGVQGDRDAHEICRYVSDKTGYPLNEILIGSTGVIGKPLDIPSIKKGIEDIIPALNEKGGIDAAEAIMTTDLVLKQMAVRIEIDGKPCSIGGMAKGSGMIHPNLATMIAVITTDVNITKTLLDKAFKKAIDLSFNRISVDGDTSVCDMSIILANGYCGNNIIEKEDEDYKAFEEALEWLCIDLAKKVAADGEGATKLIEISVKNAPTQADAFKIINSIAKSPLVKTAVFGEDANWGRILTAAGYSGASFDPDKVDIYLDNVMVCKNGTALDFDETKASSVLRRKEISIIIDLKDGSFNDRMWTCDFTFDYIKINGSYRT